MLRLTNGLIHQLKVLVIESISIFISIYFLTCQTNISIAPTTRQFSCVGVEQGVNKQGPSLRRSAV